MARSAPKRKGVDPCISFQKNLQTEALRTQRMLKGVFSSIKKSDIKCALIQAGTRKGSWPSRNFHVPSPPRGLVPLGAWAWVRHLKMLFEYSWYLFPDFQEKLASHQGNLLQIMVTADSMYIIYISQCCASPPTKFHTLTTQETKPAC